MTTPTAEQQALLEPMRLPGSDQPLNLFRTLVKHPALMKRTNVLAGLFMAKGQLPARTRELVILRVAGRTHCDYEYVQHVPIAGAAGLSTAEIEACAGLAEASWSEQDGRVIAVTDSVLDNGAVTDAAWDALAQDYTEPELLELIMLIGFYRMLADVMNCAGIPPDG